MDDKNLMQNMLLLEKGVCDLFMHGTIESSTKNVNKAFNNALNDALCMQNNIYSKMESKGWYTNEQADQVKVDNLKQQYGNCTCNCK